MTTQPYSSDKGNEEYSQAQTLIKEINNSYMQLVQWAVLACFGELDEQVIHEMAQQAIDKGGDSRQFALHCHLRIEREIAPNYQDKNALKNTLHNFDKVLLKTGADDIAKTLYELKREEQLIESAKKQSSNLKDAELKDAQMLTALMQSQLYLDTLKAQVLCQIHQRHLDQSHMSVPTKNTPEVSTLIDMTEKECTNQQKHSI